MTESSPRNALDSGLATYAYSYPHKSSYRPLAPPVPLAEAWRAEDVSRLALYVHIPFCEMRCGFCNLFTQSQPAADLVAAYLAALERQARIVRDQMPDGRFEQCAVGGGTPTLLEASQLARLLTLIERYSGKPIRDLPTSLETSPAQATPERLRVLREFGVRRISLGVQSFVAAENRRLGRPQPDGAAQQALERIRDGGFPVLNVDLIYGDEDQSLMSWRFSLREACRHRPEELYLYPLYVRPGTGLARTGGTPAAHRVDLYRLARDYLREQGYQQVSLRCFRRPEVRDASTYACQRDGMIGLGCGARSYTSVLHYATRFAVTQAGVRAILADWLRQTDREWALATHGVWLSAEEQARRYAILSLFQAEGLLLADWERRFPDRPIDDLEGIAQLVERGWVDRTAERVALTELGLEHSDAAGPLLYSAAVRERLHAFVEFAPAMAGGSDA